MTLRSFPTVLVRRFSKRKAGIVHDLLLVFSSSAVSSGATVLINLLAARQLGPAKYGVLSFNLSLIQSIVLIGDLGLTTTLVCYWSKLRDSPERQHEIL